MDHNVSFPDIEKIKVHFRKNKDRYKFFGFGVFAGITLVIMRGRVVGIQGVSSGLDAVTIRPLAFFSSQTNNILTVLERQGRGHPGYPVWCPELEKLFMSQSIASEKTGIPNYLISQNVTGKIPHARGLTFQRMGIEF